MLCKLISFIIFQAQARCHRIGQSKSVKIYRLITRNSYEREMFDKASLKLGLDKAVLQSMSGRENATNGVRIVFFIFIKCLKLLNKVKTDLICIKHILKILKMLKKGI